MGKILVLSVALLVSQSFLGCDHSSPESVPLLYSLDDQLNGLGISDVQKYLKIGIPAEEIDFYIKDISDEFRIEILNVYDKSNPVHADVKIREFTWIDGEYFVTVWFHLEDSEWRCFDSLKWHEDIRF